MSSRLVTPLVALSALSAPAPAKDYPVQPVPFTAVRVTGGFWQSRQEVNRTVTVPFALRQCEETGRMKNFDLAAETLRRRAAGEKTFQNKPATIYPFDDSDVYKVIEGAAYTLSLKRDPALESQLDACIARIAAAQEPDGYLYTFRTMHPDTPAHEWIDPKRWLKDPDLSHELYNLGHLYEAGVAYYQATGKRTLLDVCLRSAELVWHDFGDRKLRIAPGHQVIEMGLAKLYRVTGDARWLELAQIFLEARGPGGKAYSQQHELIINQTEAVGHSVRANYMYAGMADIAALTGDARYVGAITRIWESAANRKMYLTGGVGARRDGEAYGADYELPNDGYNETCAAIAFMMWNHRMFLLTGDAKYLDVLERVTFNGFISGSSLTGDRFFYPNPLVYDGAAKFNHGFAGRAPWFGCACCPPNLMRTTAAITGYFYAVRDRSLYVNFYAASEGEVAVDGGAVKVKQETDYPWQGRVKLTVSPAKPQTFALRVRIPGWVRGQPVPSDLYAYDDPAAAAWSIRVGGQTLTPTLDHGFAVIEREWRAGDTVELDLPMPVKVVHGNPKIAAVQGTVAVERGPVLYCAEGTPDNPAPATLTLSPRATFEARPEPALLGGVTTLVVTDGAEHFTAIPYYSWNNRGLAAMSVWFKRAK
ncbi:MAG TPA: glycoside hydrolase family 127 protein [Opitutaceae bacterium]|nr:glycoside hydrolase family 127 protein [Opitutaceae bacterium]HND61530.1 glycoside hydrolase family 127 protein [Opitutaceae bacterium]